MFGIEFSAFGSGGMFGRLGVATGAVNSWLDPREVNLTRFARNRRRMAFETIEGGIGRQFIAHSRHSFADFANMPQRQPQTGPVGEQSHVVLKNHSRSGGRRADRYRRLAMVARTKHPIDRQWRRVCVGLDPQIAFVNMKCKFLAGRINSRFLVGKPRQNLRGIATKQGVPMRGRHVIAGDLKMAIAALRHRDRGNWRPVGTRNSQDIPPERKRCPDNRKCNSCQPERNPSEESHTGTSPVSFIACRKNRRMTSGRACANGWLPGRVQPTNRAFNHRERASSALPSPARPRCSNVNVLLAGFNGSLDAERRKLDVFCTNTTIGTSC